MVRGRSPDTRRAVGVAAAVLLSGCVAKQGALPRGPEEPPAAFPDAEVILPGPGDDAAADGGVPDRGPLIDDDGGTLTYWRDVYPIVFQRCTGCHANEERDRLAGAPPIVTYPQTQALSDVAVGQHIYERMAARVLNPSGGAGGMPPMGSVQQLAMSLEERQTIARWANAGALEGQRPANVIFPDASVVDTDAGPRVPWSAGPVNSDAGVPGVRYVDVFANQGGDHTVAHMVQGRRTNYHCFVFTVPPHPDGVAGEFAIEFLPVLDQWRHIHHMEIYRQDPNDPRDPVGNGGPEQWHLDTWWDCENRSSQEQLIANFVPGMPVPIRLPQNVGFQIQPGDRLMLEIHYDQVPPPSLPDMTGFRVTTTSTQPGMINAGEFWVGPLFNWDIAPVVDNTMATRVAISSECVITDPVTVFSLKAHMHARGYRQEFWVRRAGSMTNQIFAEVEPWDPGSPPVYDVPLAEQQFEVGDVIGTRCVFQTEARDLIWGNGGNDEMCFFNLVHYPYTFGQDACWTRCRRDHPEDCPVQIMNP